MSKDIKLIQADLSIGVGKFELSSEELEVLGSETVEALLLKLILLAQKAELQTAEELRGDLEQGYQEGQRKAEAYMLLSAPENVAARKVEPEQLVNIAAGVVAQRNKVAGLEEKSRESDGLVGVNYMQLRLVVVEQFLQNGGTRIPSGLMGNTIKDAMNLGVMAAGMASVMGAGNTERRDIQMVVTDTEELVINSDVYRPKKKSASKEQGGSFDWEEFFGDREKSKDISGVQGFRNAINGVIKELDLYKEGQVYSYTEAMETLMELNFSDLYLAFHDKRGLAIMSLQRILAVIYRKVIGRYIDYTDPMFAKLALDIKEGEIQGDEYTKIADHFTVKSWSSEFEAAEERDVADEKMRQQISNAIDQVLETSKSISQPWDRHLVNLCGRDRLVKLTGADRTQLISGRLSQLITPDEDRGAPYFNLVTVVETAYLVVEGGNFKISDYAADRRWVRMEILDQLRGRGVLESV